MELSRATLKQSSLAALSDCSLRTRLRLSNARLVCYSRSSLASLDHLSGMQFSLEQSLFHKVCSTKFVEQTALEPNSLKTVDANSCSAIVLADHQV